MPDVLSRAQVLRALATRSGRLNPERLRSVRLCSEWVENRHTQTGDVTFVAGNKRQAVCRCSRRHQTVDHWNRANSTHAAPAIGNQIVDAEDARAELRLNFPKPFFKSTSLFRVTPAREFYAFANLANDQCTQKQIRGIDQAIPVQHARITTLAFADFRNDIRVEQIAQSSTSRPKSLGRVRSMSSDGPLASTSFKLIFGGVEKRR